MGIQLISRVLHHFIPSHVVDCDHTHDEPETGESDDEPHERHMHGNGHAHKSDGLIPEDTPLLSREDFDNKPRLSQRSLSAFHERDVKPSTAYLTTSSQRPTFQTRLTGLVSGRKASCDQNGPCHGYSDPCAAECFKAINRSPTSHAARISSTGPPRQSNLLRTVTDSHSGTNPVLFRDVDEDVDHRLSRSQIRSEDTIQSIYRGRSGHRQPNNHDLRTSSEAQAYDPESNRKHGTPHERLEGNPPNDSSQAHHHHVPTNAFLSIGLQTSIAIALHKLPEGFITYATNHANPKLGFSVFMALFIHNITEGFAMALPLYLAINSRWKAMFWSSLLGGVSQPLGAGIAALWFKAAGKGDMAPGQTVYGCMFAITAGIMASVALQLFSESLALTHNRNLCIAFAFLGMAILGISFALTAG